jgi:hypothetical protein
LPPDWARLELQCEARRTAARKPNAFHDCRMSRLGEVRRVG